MSIRAGIIAATRAYEDATGRKLYAIRIDDEDLDILYTEVEPSMWNAATRGDGCLELYGVLVYA